MANAVAASVARLSNGAVPALLGAHQDRFALALRRGAPGFEYLDGKVCRERPMRSQLTVNGTDSYLAACIARLGIIQALRSRMLPSTATGDLVEVMSQHTCEPLPVSLVRAYPR